jgi:uncharacterized membrane protein YhhN
MDQISQSIYEGQSTQSTLDDFTKPTNVIALVWGKPPRLNAVPCERTSGVRYKYLQSFNALETGQIRLSSRYSIFPATMMINLPPAPAVYLLLGSLPLLVLSDTKSFYLGHAVFKILSSIAFLSGPLKLVLSTTPSSPYRQLITAGLLFSMLGDIFLIPSSKEYNRITLESKKKGKAAKQSGERPISTSFQLGIVAFAAAHIAYILAFLRNNHLDTLDWTPFTATFVGTMLFAKWVGVIYPSAGASSSLPLYRRSNVLNLAVPRDLRPLVLIYAIIISSMLGVAVSTTPKSSPGQQQQRVLGAAMFVVSDVFVAKDAFGKRTGRRGWLEAAVGFGLYFWGQMFLAGTVE